MASAPPPPGSAYRGRGRGGFSGAGAAPRGGSGGYRGKRHDGRPGRYVDPASIDMWHGEPPAVVPVAPQQVQGGEPRRATYRNEPAHPYTDKRRERACERPRDDGALSEACEEVRLMLERQAIGARRTMHRSRAQLRAHETAHAPAHLLVLEMSHLRTATASEIARPSTRATRTTAQTARLTPRPQAAAALTPRHGAKPAHPALSRPWPAHPGRQLLLARPPTAVTRPTPRPRRGTPARRARAGRRHGRTRLRTRWSLASWGQMGGGRTARGRGRRRRPGRVCRGWWIPARPRHYDPRVRSGRWQIRPPRRRADHCWNASLRLDHRSHHMRSQRHHQRMLDRCSRG